MPQLERESLPSGGTRQAIESSTATKNQSQSTAAHAYAVLVTSTDNKCRRRLFLSLHSAEKAIQRAEARGHFAELELCRVVVV